MRILQAAWVMGALVTTSALAGAERPMVGLHYVVEDGATACPNESELRTRVTEAVGYDPFVADAPRSFLIEISRGELFSARLVDRSGPLDGSTRVLTSSVSCDDLVQSVVLALSISLDPEVERKGAKLDPPQSPPANMSVTVLPLMVPVYFERPLAKGAPAPSDKLDGIAGVGFGAGGGFVPGLSLGPTALLGLRKRHWEVSVEGTFQVPGSSVTGFGTVVAHSGMASLLPCFTPSFASWGRALLCGNVSFGAIVVGADDVETEMPTIMPIGFTGPRLGVALRVASHLEIRFVGDGLANLLPLEAKIRASGVEVVAYESPPIAARAISAVAVNFP